MSIQVSSPSAISSQSLTTFEVSDNNAMKKRLPQTQLKSKHQRRGSTATPPRSTKRLHQCTMCERSYDRYDHLTRHLLSHDNTRPFQCSRCGKGFNRLDLLNRHVLGHNRNSANNNSSTIRRPKERASQACKGCVAAKTKCEDDKPCKRCRTKGMTCVPPSPSATNRARACTASMYQGSEQLHSSSRSTSPEREEMQTSFEQTSSSRIIASEGPRFTMDKPSSLDYEMLDDPEPNLMSGERTLDHQMEMYPSFFEQIMMPQTVCPILSQDLVVPPDVLNFVQDMDFSLDDFDFQLLEDFSSTDFFPGDLTRDDKEGEVSSSPGSTLSLRADAFQLSPWEWVPPLNHDSLSKQNDISIAEGDVPRDEELPGTMQRQSLSEILDLSSRDKIFKVVMNICSSNSISTFPSLTLLAKVMQAFYVQETKSLEGRVHTNTLTLSNTRPELLLAIISAGAVTVNSDAIQKMGIAFQEIVRLAVAELFERNNHLTRDLQALQAYMLWLDVGLWSGYKRSMEIAGGFLQPLHTLLIKAKAFARDNQLAVEVQANDSAEAIQLLWQEWRAKESLKRIGIQAFLHDSRASLALLRNPIISYVQMNMPLPCSRDLWMASNAQAWVALLTSGTLSILSPSPALVDIFLNIDILDGTETKVDTYLCLLTTLHATAAQVWDYRQQAAFAHNVQGTTDETTSLLSHAFQNHTYKTLTKLRQKCDTLGHGAPEVILLAEFLMMFLNVSLDDVQRFAGKDGESDARSIVPAMRKWCHGREARRAVWHAGQALRAAKSFRHAQLRGFHAVAVYFSALTLWVYGLIIDDADLHSAVQTPTQSESIQGSTPRKRRAIQNLPNYGFTNTGEEPATVILDGADVPEIRSFIMFNQGQPGLTSTNRKHHDSVSPKPPFCSLRHTKSVMINAAAILQANYSHKSDSPPLIVRTLVDLMKKLAELSEKEAEATKFGSLGVCL